MWGVWVRKVCLWSECPKYSINNDPYLHTIVCATMTHPGARRDGHLRHAYLRRPGRLALPPPLHHQQGYAAAPSFGTTGALRSDADAISHHHHQARPGGKGGWSTWSTTSSCARRATPARSSASPSAGSARRSRRSAPRTCGRRRWGRYVVVWCVGWVWWGWGRWFVAVFLVFNPSPPPYDDDETQIAQDEGNKLLNPTTSVRGRMGPFGSFDALQGL